MSTLLDFMGINQSRPRAYESAKYYGLVNQGATCFLNSILQILYMNEDFRERVKSYTRSNPETEHIDRELSDLFTELEENKAYTNNITNKLKISNVNEQHDAAEFYEKILRLTSPGASQIFHGELTNRSKCQECDKVTESAVGFWHISLPLADSRAEHSVVRGIEEFFHPSVISGDDQMYCEKCEDKRDAVLDCVVKSHPEVLVLLIKRFEYDFSQRRYLKIACVVDIPHTLHIQNKTYELYGIVEHLNEQTSGRYIATIKSQYDRRWYTFDDSDVYESRHQYFHENSTEKSKTAYLLFYQKVPYHGLLNLGATCYLNSVLQVLFLTDDFKASVTRHTMRNPETEHIDRDLSDLFCELEERCAYTYNIIRKLKINDVDVQRDAAEHYEKILRLCSPEASQIFHGQMHNSTKCLKCQVSTESTTGFWHLPLSLVESPESYSVVRSINDFLHREVQMYCSTCGEETVAAQMCELKHPPDVLVILLKRFEYDDRQMRNIKNNREVVVPYTLHMPQVEPYQLYASVDHFGELRFGHYIAEIRSKKDGRWYIFDDMNILRFHNSIQEHSEARSHTAYLLFYQRQKDAIFDAASEIPARAPETVQVEGATVAPNTQDNTEEREDAVRRASVLSDKTKTKDDVSQIKQQALVRDPKNTQKDDMEVTEDGQDVHLSDNTDREETPDNDIDRLTDSFCKMKIYDLKESMFQQADSDTITTQAISDCPTVRMSKTFKENTVKEDKIQEESLAQSYKSSSNHCCTCGENEDQVNGFQNGDELDIGACALDEFYNVQAYKNLTDGVGYTGYLVCDRAHELVENTNINTGFELGEMTADFKKYTLKLVMRSKDSDCQDKRVEVMRENRVQDEDEDFQRVKATKVFIMNEEQMKNEEMFSTPLSGCKSLPLEINNEQINPEASGLRASGGATSRDKETRARSHLCKFRLDGLESLGVIRQGDTEIIKYIPKNKRENEQNANGRRMSESSQDPETTRHLTHV